MEFKTKNDLRILRLILEKQAKNEGRPVIVTYDEVPMHQKNFYTRITSLERKGLIVVKREIGKHNLYNTTALVTLAMV